MLFDWLSFYLAGKDSRTVDDLSGLFRTQDRILRKLISTLEQPVLSDARSWLDYCIFETSRT
jgi:hypothetical protein